MRLSRQTTVSAGGAAANAVPAPDTASSNAPVNHAFQSLIARQLNRDNPVIRTKNLGRMVIIVWTNGTCSENAMAGELTLAVGDLEQIRRDVIALRVPEKE
jgi:hypothetical protein